MDGGQTADGGWTDTAGESRTLTVDDGYRGDVNNYTEGALSTHYASHRLRPIDSSQPPHELGTVIPLFSNQEIGAPLAKVTAGAWCGLDPHPGFPL